MYLDFLSSIKAKTISGTTVCGVNICTSSSSSSPIVIGTSCVRSPLISGTSVLVGGIAYSALYASGVSANGPINASYLKANYYGSNKTSIQLNWDAADNYGIGAPYGGGSNIVKLEGSYSTVVGRGFNNNPVDFRVTGCVSGSTKISSPIIYGNTCACSPIVCATTCIDTACVVTTCECITTKLNINNPSNTTRDLNVGANGINNMGNFQMCNDKAFFFGSTSDSGTRYKLFTINCHAYMDFYDCLIIRSGPTNSPDVAYITSGGTICACQSFKSPIVCAVATTPTVCIYSTSLSGGLNLTANGSAGHTYIDNTKDDGSYNVYFRMRTAGTPIDALTLYGSGVVCAGVCFAGSGAGLTGNASSLCVLKACELQGVGGRPITRTTTGTSYNNMYQFRETLGYVSCTAQSVAPAFAFHWGGVAASTVQLETSGAVSIRNGNGDAYENLKVLNLVASAAVCAGSCVCAVHLYGTTCVCSPVLCASTCITANCIGIGGSPVKPLHICSSDSGYGQMRIQNTTTGEVSINYRDSAGSDANSWTVGKGTGGIGNDFGWYWGGCNMMRLGSTGRFTLCSTISEDVIGYITNISSVGYGVAINAGSSTRYILSLRDYQANQMFNFFANGNMCAAACGTAVDWVATSDCRVKTDIQPIQNALSTVMCLQGVCYHQCDDETCEMHLGLIAQDVQKVLPAVVSHGIPSEADAKYGITDDKLGLKYDKLSAVLIEAIKEQQKQIKEQQKQLNCLCKDLTYYINLNYSKE